MRALLNFRKNFPFHQFSEGSSYNNPLKNMQNLLDLLTLPNLEKHLVIVQFETSSQSNRPNSKNGEKHFFTSLDHFKMHFFAFWKIPHDLLQLSIAEKHFVLSLYAISSRSNTPNSRKWPKTSVLGLWIIQKCIFVIFEWSSLTW